MKGTVREDDSLSVSLVIPPGWTLISGGPHLALPALGGALRDEGFKVSLHDLNLGFAAYQGADMPLPVVVEACREPSLDSLNAPYFEAEDKLACIAERYGCGWNLQLGFSHPSYSAGSPAAILDAAEQELPFTGYYRSVAVPRILEDNPGLIGISVTSPPQLISAFQLARLIREAGAPARVVIGGNTISRLRDEILSTRDAFRFADAFVFFQGEAALTDLARRLLRDHQEWRDVPNVAWVNGDRIVHSNSSSPPSPDDLPAPSFEGLPLGQYWGVNYLPLVAARGCYYGKCKFCAIPYGWGGGGFTGTRNADLVHNDMVKSHRATGITRFKFVDEAMPPSLMRDLSTILLRTDSILEWEGAVRLERCWLDQAFVHLVSRAGFRKAYFGLETVPSRSRRAMNKRDCEDVLRIIENCAVSGVKVHLYCMVGYPGTGAQDAEATVSFISDNLELIDTVDIYRFCYEKHTEVSLVEKEAQSADTWALDYEYVPRAPGVLNSREVAALREECESAVWELSPRLLHPTYRLVSPWSVSA